jgi:Ca2+-binding EF-hand superfamily protein
MKFLAKARGQHATTKDAFYSWCDPAQNYISHSHFGTLMRSWGFQSAHDELFAWLDSDNDGRISYEDLFRTLGVHLSPQEDHYFRYQ